MKDRSNQKCSPLGIKATIVLVVLNIVFLFGAALLFIDYSRCLKIQKAVDNGVIVEAEIVYLDRTAHISQGNMQGYSYTVVCRYVDENGIIYECSCGSGTSADYEQEKIDEQRIGEKVEIYIGEVLYDNKGACWAVSNGADVKAWTQLVFGLLFVFLIFVTFVLLALYLLYFYDKIPFKRRSAIETKNDGEK